MSEENKSPIPTKEWLEQKAKDPGTPNPSAIFEVWDKDNSQASTKEGLEERAEAYARGKYVKEGWVTATKNAYIAGAQSSLQPSLPDPTVLVQALKRIEKICLRDWINEEKAQKYFRDTLNIVEEALNKYNNKKEEGICQINHK